MSSGRCGTAWAPSTTARARRPRAPAGIISATGLIVPSTFETWANATTRRARREQPVEARRCRGARRRATGTATQARAPVAAGHLPRDQVRVMLHLGDEDLVAGLRSVRPIAWATRFMPSVVPRVKMISSRLGRADEAPHRVARRLVQLGRLLAQGVDRAVHVGVALLVVARHRLQHRARLLARGGGVEVDERPAVDDARTGSGSRRGVCSPCVMASPLSPLERAAGARSAAASRTSSAMGRMSACEPLEQIARRRAPAASHGRPTASSSSTSADGRADRAASRRRYRASAISARREPAPRCGSGRRTAGSRPRTRRRARRAARRGSAAAGTARG